MDSSTQNIFRRGSKTYFYSSLFFPKDIKQDVSTLYAFVRVADDFVDSMPAQKKEFHAFRKKFEDAYQDKKCIDPVIFNFVSLMQKCNLKKEWVDVFLDTMQQDLSKKKYDTLAELEKYMYGSAEVVGLMMAKILHLPPASYKTAALLGKSMQYINFIRDIDEDNSLGRTYIPSEILEKYDLNDLSQESFQHSGGDFSRLIRTEIQRYFSWQKEASLGFKYLPRRYRIPIQTASEMYNWTATQLSNNPAVIFQKKVKPSIIQIVQRGLWIAIMS